ncbi:type II pantothenate kinase [Planococcus shenhongbingii]|uniref:Type II pantothenate kinase n=1 Tax=Planococcus shenhongbingii TaxID=3058398 RepID=A0ABT8NFX4_9BACL|nr:MULTISPECIES: type II pantothenate kinase [unclassified Planococcus (in: firmicutes)]MDN7246804.1 type II pantothenate kinase [Planococcus sp. N017]WKA58838.1 type II pantothenate kinase [Planococcus sp. N016]
MIVGIDAGGTLIKVAYSENGSSQFTKYPIAEIEQVAAWVNELDNPEVCLTGGKSGVLRSLLTKEAKEMVEFEATHQGVQFLLDQMGREEAVYVVTNVGTGTSIHCIQNNAQERLGGTGVGGGTLVGLSHLLTGITDFEEIVELASKGSRDRIDLKVKHIYEDKEPPIPGDLTASNFGNDLFSVAGELSKEELLATVVGLVGETVSTLSVIAARQCQSSTVIYIGSSFIHNPLLKEVVETYTILRGSKPLFLENGEFSGAVGAMISLT